MVASIHHDTRTPVLLANDYSTGGDRLAEQAIEYALAARPGSPYSGRELIRLLRQTNPDARAYLFAEIASWLQSRLLRDDRLLRESGVLDVEIDPPGRMASWSAMPGTITLRIVLAPDSHRSNHLESLIAGISAGLEAAYRRLLYPAPESDDARILLEFATSSPSLSRTDEVGDDSLKRASDGKRNSNLPLAA